MPMNTFDYKKVKDPQYFRDARMDAHSDHIYYRTKEEAEEKQSSYRVSLNGLWKFHYAKNYADVVAGFEKEDYCCVGWDETGKTNWRYRCLSGQRAAGARIRISSGFPESTAMYTCILCRKYMPMM